MSDSDEKEKPKTEALMILGQPREMIRASDGRFAKRPKKSIDRRLKAEEIEKLIFKPVKGPDGKLDKDAKNNLHDMWAQAIEFVRDPETWKDPKKAQVASNILKEATLYGIGKPKPSEDEMDAMKFAGIKVVFVPTPTDLPKVDEVKKEKSKEPDFVEGEVIE